MKVGGDTIFRERHPPESTNYPQRINMIQLMIPESSQGIDAHSQTSTLRQRKRRRDEDQEDDDDKAGQEEMDVDTQKQGMYL